MLQLIRQGALMKRDDDLCRELLLDIEAAPDPQFEYFIDLGSDDEVRRIYFHLRLLVDAGFLEETGKQGGMFRITNAGHDFIAVTRRSAAWDKAKGIAAGVGGVSLGILRDIAIGLAREEIRKLGLPLD